MENNTAPRQHPNLRRVLREPRGDVLSDGSDLRASVMTERNSQEIIASCSWKVRPVNHMMCVAEHHDSQSTHPSLQ